MKTIKNIIYPALALFAFACFVLSPRAQAVVPAPDGGYPNGNTAEGEDALFSLDTSQGFNNTANGFEALYNNATGGANTATGNQALYSNSTGNNNTANGDQALYVNQTGNSNTADGYQALFGATGSSNIAIGVSAGANITTGSNN